MALIRDIKPHRILGPGDHIREFMEIFNWTQEDLASVIGISLKHLNKIVKNKQAITIDIAKLLSKVFNHSPQFWIALDTDYRLKLKNKRNNEADIGIKAMLFKYMPINEMIKRGWINKSKDAHTLFNSVKSFWGTNNIDDNYFQNMYSQYALRKSEAFESFNFYYVFSWLQMSKNIAKKIRVKQYNKSKLEELVNNINKYTTEEDGIELFLSELESTGVKFIFLKHLPQTYIDGATFFDDGNPVIVYTGRYNRNDNFWFTISHEIGHVLHHLDNEGTGIIEDENAKMNNNKIEKEANEFAAKVLKQNLISSFFKNNMSYVTKKLILECSQKYNIHPGIVIGTLAHKKEISYAQLHKYVEKVIIKIPQKYHFG